MSAHTNTPVSTSPVIKQRGLRYPPLPSKITQRMLAEAIREPPPMIMAKRQRTGNNDGPSSFERRQADDDVPRIETTPSGRWTKNHSPGGALKRKLGGPTASRKQQPRDEFRGSQSVSSNGRIPSLQSGERPERQNHDNTIGTSSVESPHVDEATLRSQWAHPARKIRSHMEWHMEWSPAGTSNQEPADSKADPSKKTRPQVDEDFLRSHALSTEALIQNPREPPPKIGRLIIGIDMGTSRFAVATAEIIPGRSSAIEPTIFNTWDGSGQDAASFPPTALYYPGFGEPPLIGFTLKRQLKQRHFQQALKHEQLFSMWKILFHGHQDDPLVIDMQDKLQEKLNLLGMDRDDLLRDWVKLLYAQLWRGMPRAYSRFNQLEIDIAVAVPPGRTTIVHESVRKAFVQGRISSNAVTLVSEPAALFRAWLGERGERQDWKVGQTVLIGDGGAGTVCYVPYIVDQLDPLKFRQTRASESLMCGAETISEAFDKLAQQKVPKNWPHRSWVLTNMRNEFDRSAKSSFGEEYDQGDFLVSKGGEDEGYWEFTREEIAGCFRPCVQNIIRGALRQIRHGGSFDYFILGGGLFLNAHVVRCIKERIPNIPVLKADWKASKELVARGTVLERLHGDFVCPFFRSKAIPTYKQVTRSIRKLPFFDNLAKIPGKYDEKVEFIHIAEFIAKPGDHIKPGDSYVNTDAEDARKRLIQENPATHKFEEEILTFDFTPQKEDQWVAQCKDKSWVDERGAPVPSPEKYEPISWSVTPDTDIVGGYAGLDTERQGRSKLKVLRYSVLLKYTELETNYRVRVWPSEKMQKGWGMVAPYESEVTKLDPITSPEEISRSLAESFGFERDR